MLPVGRRNMSFGFDGFCAFLWVGVCDWRFCFCVCGVLIAYVLCLLDWLPVFGGFAWLHSLLCIFAL